METGKGCILEVVLSGRYPPGSFGNPHAARMMELARRIVEQERPAAVLFGLRRLDYVWGDAIFGLISAVADPAHETFLPACILAEGRTASALNGLCQCFWDMGIGLFRDRANAEAYLQERLASRDG
jgi:hypothetical protein